MYVTYKKLKRPTQQKTKYDVNMLKDHTIAYISCINENLEIPLRNDSIENV